MGLVTYSNQAKTNILKIYNILEYLEKEGKVKLSDGINSPSKVKIIIPSSDLYKFQITNKFYDPFIKLVLRSHNNIFNHSVVTNAQKIASQLNISASNLKKIFLKQIKILLLVEGCQTMMIFLI